MQSIFTRGIDAAEAAYPVVYLIWVPMGETWACRGYLLEDGVVRPVPGGLK